MKKKFMTTLLLMGAIAVMAEGSSIPDAVLAVQEPSFEGYSSDHQPMNGAWNPTPNDVYAVIREDFGKGVTHFPTDGATDGSYYALMRTVGTISQELGSVNAGGTLSVTFADRPRWRRHGRRLGNRPFRFQHGGAARRRLGQRWIMQ